jgi:hypothetical protein
MVRARLRRRRAAAAWQLLAALCSQMLLLLLLLLGVGVPATCGGAALPPFSWSTVPLFQQLCSVNATLEAPFEPERLAWLAATYPVIVIEHCQGQGPQAYDESLGPAPYQPTKGYIEQHQLAAAAALKKLNASVHVYNYQNVHAALPYFKFVSALTDHPSFAIAGAHCSSTGGHMFPLLKTNLWNTSEQAVVELWKAQFAAMTGEGSAVDGTFVDTAQSCGDTGAAAMLAAVQASRPGKVLGYHTTETMNTGLQMVQTYTFDASKTSLKWLRDAAAAKLITLAHAQTDRNNAHGDHFNSSLAAFLIGASEHQYFAFSGSPTKAGGPTGAGAAFCDPRTPTAPTYPTWCTGMGWGDEFSRPLGAPIGPAAVTSNGALHTRSFASGTNVTLRLGGKVECRIEWADGGPPTVCSSHGPDSA